MKTSTCHPERSEGPGRMGGTVNRATRPSSSLATLGMTVFALAFGFSVLAQETTTTAPPEKKDSALVEAAKKSKPRPKTTRKVITNADVKKSKGKLVVLPPKTQIAGENDQTVVDPRSPLQKQDQDLRERKAAELAVGSAEKKVGDLEKELNRIEQSFYDENDATYRDEVIQKRFDQTKRQLDDARKELSDARDRLAQFNKQ